MRRSCNTARGNTTFELPIGNGRTGAPVIAFGKRHGMMLALSGGLVRNQGGTVEYIIYYVSHP